MDSEIINVFLEIPYFMEGSCILAVFLPMTWRAAITCARGGTLLASAALDFCSLNKILESGR